MIRSLYRRITAIWTLTLLFALPGRAAIVLTPEAQFSLLTCSPGSELYSLFGHTALRVNDIHDGKILDFVFNYGTFDYSDDFYVKFARGKLDYKLSVSRFGDFQKEYIDEMRGIEEQVLILSHSQKCHLWALLQTNYLPENQTYRYDFFYDNCSTRARDIVLLACQLAHDYPIPDSLSTSPSVDYQMALQRAFPIGDDPSGRVSLSNDHSVRFTYTYPYTYSFRDAIDTYLKYQPWSDFGIDIALGLPCDRTILPTQSMFLPDSLKLEFHYGIAGEGPIVQRTEDLLFNETQLVQPRIFTPFWVFTCLFLLLLWMTYRRYILWPSINILDRLVLIVVGLIGLLVVFLWFFTDHHATVYNLNILWAHPIWLYLAFFTKTAWSVRLAKVGLGVLVLTLLSFAFLPQQLHVATIPLMGCCVLVCAKMIVADKRRRSIPPQIAN